MTEAILRNKISSSTGVFPKASSISFLNWRAELVGFKPQCIVAVGFAPSIAVKQATNAIPIVMGNADDDPVRHGLVASLNRPGGNVTGFTNIGSELAGKRLEILKEIVSRATRVAFFSMRMDRVESVTFVKVSLSRQLWDYVSSDWN